MTTKAKENDPGIDDLGVRGEVAAALFLERSGMTIVERNWTTKRGEVDIIAIDEDELVFVEVKTRHSHSKGMPEDAVNAAKRERYGKLATEYLASHEEYADFSVRFDVIAITAQSENSAMLRHHRYAFVCD